MAVRATVDESDVAVGALEDACVDPGAVDCSPMDVEDGELEHEVEEESDRPRGIRDPGQPSAAERAEHELSHIPMRPWCKHCVRGKAKDKPSLRIKGAYSGECHPRVRLDYCFLTGNEDEVTKWGGTQTSPSKGMEPQRG